MKKLFAFTLIVWFCSITGCTKDPIKVLIVTGQNNHKWQASSVILQKYLNESGLFFADIVVSPKKGEDMSGFRPDFSAYKTVVLDYTDFDGDPWPKATNDAFIDFVKKGGGVVVFHAVASAFPKWKEFNEIIGLGAWGDRNEKDGPYVYFEDDKEVRDYSPGPAGSHGRQHEFVVTIRDKNHPITKGLPASWTHAKDELYDRMRGPAVNMTVLSTAFSDKSTGGSGRHEPALMVIHWGKGRIFHSILGHIGPEQTEYPALECASFRTTFLRGTEWTATGKVTQKIPADFPLTANH